MRAGKYNYKDLFVNRYVEQLIIPEIQRDYVWQKPQVVGLMSSIAEDFLRFEQAEIPVLSSGVDCSDSKQLNADFADFYCQRNHSSNIGFIYAYSDQQYDGRYFLIDGQQRITTLYLVLLLLAVRTDNATDFEKQYCIKTMPKLDYRVRDSACNFIRQLVSFVLSNPNADFKNEIKEQYWYLSSYENDTTVTNIINNFAIILDWLDEKEINESKFYLYLNDFTEFWYFDTNISAQGENLYIYLNARGEQMQGNENLKAELLSGLGTTEQKNTMGAEWENWQDFFWRMRAKGVRTTNIDKLNADKGFNEFLNCIAGLNIYLEDDGNSWVDKHKSLKPSQSVLTQVLSLNLIAKYIKALSFIIYSYRSLTDTYNYTDWVEHFLNEFWSILNTTTTAWVIDYNYDRFSSERRKMVFIWGVLHWVDSALRSDKKLTTYQIFRGVRQFYLRYKNNMRSVTGDNGIKSSVNSLLETGFVSGKSEDEEYKKERWLIRLNKNESNWASIESMLWQIEDHPFNLDGSDVGLTNSSHLVDYDEGSTLEKLTQIKNTFYDCFPADKSNDSSKFPKIQSLLLHYGQFWRQRTPYYYSNYQFNDWRNIVRSGTPFLKEREFKVFFDELMETGWSVGQLLAEKRKRYIESTDDSLLSQLLWYNNNVQEDMWNQGAYIALCEYYTDNNEDKKFDERRPFLNTKGNFKGGSPRELYTLLPEGERSS
eukprot:TRINITY_DN5_c0_g3_i2.p1 TRINITY_DN5_c0_g3~~TRINITY_DN5_c0_g3_i2.p1  ORF type:complete len:710 (+),score=128.60 TRINITY_DN5_c0_g3_i2:19529-21658(+)